MYFIGGIKEILYELFNNNNSCKKKLFRILFRFESIRNLKRNKHDKQFNVEKNINYDIHKYGFQLFNFEINDELLNYLKNRTFREDNSDLHLIGLDGVLSYKGNRSHARYTAFDLNINDKLIQNFAYSNPAYKYIESYLGEKVRLINTVCWITLPNILKDNHFEFGFHYDVANWKWVNLFIYLDDVEIEHGPHSCISTTHSKRHSCSFLERRLSFNRAIKIYGQNRINIFTGKKGTAILEDTGNYHRAMPISKNHRFMLQLTYSNFNELYG